MAWTPDSRFAAIFVDTYYCSSIREGFDVKTSTTVPFLPLADVIQRSIISEYNIQGYELVPYGGDPLEWAHSPEDGGARPGAEAFRRYYR